MYKDKKRLDLICENFINTVMDFYDLPGIAVGVYVDGISFIGAGGYRNYESKDPLHADTVFHCTSVSKLFTAMGIMKLVNQGDLSLSDRLADVLPYMKIADKRWENITIGSMLSHTSGLTDVNDYRWGEHKTEDGALKEYALSEEVAGKNLLWEPTEGRFRYSSMAYDILGLVITEISGMSFEEFMELEVFKPMGMGNTTFSTYVRTDGDLSLEVIDKADLAMPHYKGRDRTMRIQEVYPYTRQHAPSSTLTSITDDLLKWAEGLMKDDSNNCVWQPRVEVSDTGEHMGLGWFIREQEGHVLVGHEGSDDGFRTSFWMCPELGVATVLLCNLTDAPLKKLNKKLFERIIK